MNREYIGPFPAIRFITKEQRENCPTGCRLIPLTKGQVSIVDEQDYERVISKNWSISFYGYATRNLPRKFRNQNSETEHTFLHRFILESKKGEDVDHINGNKLDNRRCNLRVCLKTQNLRNQKPQVGKSSKYKGVSWSKEKGTWKAQIYIPKEELSTGVGRAKHLGYFSCEITAAITYDFFAEKYYGEFAYTNKKAGLY